MYVDKDSYGLYCLMGMTCEELEGLVRMVRGANLLEAQMFYPVLRQIG
jgi:hypothetical protein